MFSHSNSILLNKDDVHLWLIDEAQVVNAGLIPEYHTFISDEEKLTLAQFTSPKRQQQFLISRVAIRQILSFYLPNYLPLDFSLSRQANGKLQLELPQTQLQFNLSHSAGKILIGIAKGRAIGVDIENMHKARNITQIAEHSFHQKEWNDTILDKCVDINRYFYQLWTLKEASLKAGGQGLSIPLNSFYFLFDEDKTPKLQNTLPSKYPIPTMQLKHCIVDSDLSLAVAVEAAITSEVSRPLNFVLRAFTPLKNHTQIGIR